MCGLKIKRSKVSYWEKIKWLLSLTANVLCCTFKLSCENNVQTICTQQWNLIVHLTDLKGPIFLRNCEPIFYITYLLQIFNLHVSSTYVRVLWIWLLVNLGIRPAPNVPFRRSWQIFFTKKWSRSHFGTYSFFRLRNILIIILEIIWSRFIQSKSVSHINANPCFWASSLVI